jgi:hypothetical protein
VAAQAWRVPRGFAGNPHLNFLPFATRQLLPDVARAISYLNFGRFRIEC